MRDGRRVRRWIFLDQVSHVEGKTSDRLLSTEKKTAFIWRGFFFEAFCFGAFVNFLIMKAWHDHRYLEIRPKSHATVTLFCICSAVFALCLFLYGFFPLKVVNGDYATKDDIPHKVLDTSIQNTGLYQRRVSRLVFVLIDAFRWDFLNVASHMPHVHSLRRQGTATFLTARSHPPTATMPRVKALMTGSVPNYIDVVLNLGSSQVKEDSLIHQAVENGLKVVFYGDEVWLNLFPDKFVRKEGTTSFFVSDYTEVDFNVSRNIAGEMDKNDWDILILHFLGLDHIGHLAGPGSGLIPDKLREMDSIIYKLHESLRHWDLSHPQDPSLLIIIGDHGMHDLGGHGGATLGEILVSLILIENIPHQDPLFMRPEISQIDVTATLSVLLGLPIPKSSLGVLAPHALRRLSHEQYLFALLYNAQQVADQFVLTNKNAHLEDCFQMYIEAQNVHLSWLKNHTEKSRNVAETLYVNATRMMSSNIVKTLVTFDMTALVVGCSILVQVVLCLFILTCVRQLNFDVKNSKRVISSFFSGSVLLLLCSIQFSDTNVLFFEGVTLKYLCMNAYAFFLLGLNSWILLSLWAKGLNIKCDCFAAISMVLRLGCVLHTASFSASSLIEEEHQTWYFFWTTLLLQVLISVSCSQEKKSISLQCQVMILLIGHRVLRKWNQTGDKWASLPDIADWLDMPQHQIPLTLVFLVGKVGVWLSLHSLKCFQSTIDKLLHFLALMCIFVYQSSVGGIYFPALRGFSRGVLEVKMFWTLCGFIFMKALHRIAVSNSFDMLIIIRAFTSIWILTSVLLLKPCNIVLIPYLVVSSFTFKRVLEQTIDCCIVHVWLGYIVFFYQGNSNSLSTVSVAAGYIGAEHEDMFIAGLQVFIHTFSFPVLATLLLWISPENTTNLNKWNQDMITNLRTSLLLRVFPLSVYCILVSFQRTHLFIWSVFAPKLLYEAVHSVVSFVLVALGSMLLLTCDNKNERLMRL